MKCHSPVSIKDPSQADVKVRIEVPCGICIACKSNRRSEWSTRLEYELKSSTSAWFLTITYSDENLPVSQSLTPTLKKSDIQKFMKRLRKKCTEKIRYYLCGEYGENTNRPHYHMLIFNMLGNKDAVHLKILESWNLGFVHIGDVTPRSIKYTLKYMLKQQDQEENVPRETIRPFALMSKGLGSSYLSDKIQTWHSQDVTRNYVIKQGGRKERLPRYYREKLFTEAQRKYQNYVYQQHEIDQWNQKSFEEQKEELRLEHDRKEALKNRAKKILQNNSKI